MTSMHEARMTRLGLRTLALVAGFAALSSASSAEPARGKLDGAWSGTGYVDLTNGNRERARCRATFRQRGSGSYGMNAVCATASARVEQTAVLHPAGGNRWDGEFTNEEYNISGMIRLVLHGSSMRASLNGGGASAVIDLSR